MFNLTFIPKMHAKARALRLRTAALAAVLCGVCLLGIAQPLWQPQGAAANTVVAALASADAEASLDANPALKGAVPSFGNPTELHASAALAPSFQQGTASWYGPGFHNRLTANGERYNMHSLTAAHRTLPFGTLVRVRSVRTGKSVVVRINDRGPYIKGRIIDLSRAAATEIDMMGSGVAQVVLYKMPKPGSKAEPVMIGM